ncbi:la-related protein 6B [Quercus lobata]|uniref:la-related protein 6B n=1 Tax=Quercus lobata TaxID=97700 RepID=UPI001244B4DB|nr:la-related protein 6B [Quercus lobata]
MAQEDSSPDPSPSPPNLSDPSKPDPPPPSSSSSSSSSSLSRNVSFSRLNAQAPEFVPTQQQAPRLAAASASAAVVPPPPPPPPPMHSFPPPPPPPPFHVAAAIQGHVAVPPHVIPVQHPHHVPVQYHPHHPHHPHPHPHHHHQQYYGGGGGGGGGGFREQEVGTQVQNQAPVESDHVVAAASSSSAKNKISEEATQKILNQVEYYFSDLNLATTDHLMRFISKDSEGFVPISVVASFKKIKALISSHSQLAAVLRNSSKLVVSEDGKKVRRQRILTESEMEELQSRIVVAENLPEDHCHQNLMKVFSAVGSVKTIRTCQPQPSNGGASSASRSGKADGVLYSNKWHAFVEYESVELAEKAVAELNEEGNWRRGLRVRLMLRRTSKPSSARGKKGHDGEVIEEDDTSTSDQQQSEKQLEDPPQQSDAQPHEQTGEEQQHVNEKDAGQRRGRNRGRGKGRGRGQYHHNNHHNNRGNHVGTPPSNNAVNNEQPAIAKQPPGPRMPDGTRGFAMGRGKPLAVNIA